MDRTTQAPKLQIHTRISQNLMARLNEHIYRVGLKGVTVMKSNIVEKALFDYMEKVEHEDYCPT